MLNSTFQIHFLCSGGSVFLKFDFLKIHPLFKRQEVTQIVTAWKWADWSKNKSELTSDTRVSVPKPLIYTVISISPHTQIGKEWWDSSLSSHPELSQDI